MTGYLTLSGLFITPLLALDSDWILQHSSPVERWLAGGGFALAAVGVLARIRYVQGLFLSWLFGPQG